jgi:hypothetical protein
VILHPRDSLACFILLPLSPCLSRSVVLCFSVCLHELASRPPSDSEREYRIGDSIIQPALSSRFSSPRTIRFRSRLSLTRSMHVAGGWWLRAQPQNYEDPAPDPVVLVQAARSQCGERSSFFSSCRPSLQASHADFSLESASLPQLPSWINEKTPVPDSAVVKPIAYRAPSMAVFMDQ